MILIDLVFVFVFALILSGVLGWGFGWRHPARTDVVGPSLLFLFMILMFAMWAGGTWLPMWGPVFYGTPWLSLLLVGILVALLILAIATPPRWPKPTRTAVEQSEDAAVVGVVFGIFFWVLILGLLITALVHYLPM